MNKYSQLAEKPRQFLAATGLTVEEFERSLPLFREKLAGPKEKLRTDGAKLLFILIYQKTYLIQEILGLQFEISQPQANYWIHLLLPILKQTPAEIGLTPERNPES